MGSYISSADSNEKNFDKDEKEPKPGDLIEIFRGLYNHWAVYVGDGDVVHFVEAEGVSGSISGGGGGGFVGGGKVLKEKLEKVVEEDKWKVNNLLDNKHTRRSADDIVRDACKLVNTKKQYNLLIYNCEHFATEMRYGKAESQQAETAKYAPVSAIVNAAGGRSAAVSKS